ncbi:MAG: hypothetical protein KJO05_03345 [Bacteroidia bacterium]|nr:hypothetical protein [Bacteroidia bacterium]NNF32161.1 hypothetical protein [Flavobacteriaceae bacterium]MBT8276624.1 hypothetical protein [Bacteroidia bacterium]NNJ80840.1 hypothetical protein [Flavobacteriaceae bacterium]NNK55082.1 hypothetical protein [Flavobacteriaceae bacterium]
MQKIISIFLTILMLASSSGIAYAQHFCGEFEMLSEITLGEKDLSCGMAMELPGCDDETDEHDCCDNEYTKVDTDDTFAKASFEFDPGENFIFAFYSVFVLFQVENYPENPDFYKDYSPPPLERDLQVLYDTFLI